jgi:ferredoxin
MNETISNFNFQTCKACGLCAEVCPGRIIKKAAQDKMEFRADRVQLCIKCGQCMAICPTKSVTISGLSYSENFIELPEKEAGILPFSDMIVSRRAIRNFEDRLVSTELLQKIVVAISFAPPSFPPIKTELIVVQDTQKIRQALPHMIEMYDFLLRAMANPVARIFIKRSAGDEKFRLLKNHVIPIMKSRLPDLKAGTEDTITRYAPAMILFHADKKAENAREDIYIALTYGFLAAHSLGLGGSAMDLIPPAVERNKELRKMFAIPEGNEVIASMIVGFPKYRYQRAIKRNLKSIKWI